MQAKRNVLNAAEQYIVTLTATPEKARADETAMISLMATVTGPGPSLSGLAVDFRVSGGDAYFENTQQSIATTTDEAGTARASVKCGIAETGYAYAVLTITDIDKHASNEVEYEFVDGFTALGLEVWQTDAFADGGHRVMVRATVSDGGHAVPNAHLLFKLISTTAEFADKPGTSETEVMTDSWGWAEILLAASSAQTGFIQASLVSEHEVHDIRPFTFIPKPKVELQLLNDGAPADGKSPITALATVTNAQTGEAMKGVALDLTITGNHTLMAAKGWGETLQMTTDKNGQASISFTSTTPTSHLTDEYDHMVQLMTSTDILYVALDRYIKRMLYTFT